MPNVPNCSNAGESVYERLGIKPVINASGIYTDLGGSILSESIWSDLTELNSHYADLIELLNTTGEIIAGLVSAEAARVTPGASAGLALAAAACMTGDHGPYWEQLPDTAGMRDEIILQRPQASRYQYITPLRLSGANIVMAGSREKSSLDDIRAAITDKTAAILIPAHLDTLDNVARLDELGAFTEKQNVRLLVDAAYQVFPPERMKIYADLGADLTMFSSKYFFGPNAGGFLSGSREMVDIIAGLDFTRYESGPYRTFGRPFKMGRYEIASVCLALQDWFEMDHDERLRDDASKARYIADRLNEGSCTAEPCAFTFDETIEREPVNAVLLSGPGIDGRAEHIVEKLRQNSPAIHGLTFDDKVLLVTETLKPGEEIVISERVAQALGGDDRHD